MGVRECTSLATLQLKLKSGGSSAQLDGVYNMHLKG